MNTRKLLTAILGSLLACAVFVPIAGASEDNQETLVTFNQPVEIPGAVLPAGSYRFVLLDTMSDCSVVQIFSSDRKKLFATEMTISSERARSTDNSTFDFAERESSSPEALLKWFYPGETTGHEFLYPKQEEKELAHDKQLVVTASPIVSQPGS
jgi:hypothetical protein